MSRNAFWRGATARDEVEELWANATAALEEAEKGGVVAEAAAAASVWNL